MENVRRRSRVEGRGSRVFALLAVLVGWTLGAAATDLTRNVTFTDGSRLTASQLHALIDGASISTTFYNDAGKNLLTAVDPADVFLVYDVSTGLYKRMTMNTLIMANTDVITTQTEKANPTAADYFLLYDAAGVGLKKVSFGNLLLSNTNLIGLQPAITNLLLADSWFLTRNGGTNNQIELTNLWNNFIYSAALTNLTEHTTPTNTDRLLIYDRLTGTNKYTTLIGFVTNRPAALYPVMTSQISLVETGEVKQITLTSLAGVLATNTPTFTSSSYAMSGATASVKAIDTAHGLGVLPKFVRAVLVCTAGGGDLGYAQNDEIDSAQATAFNSVGSPTRAIEVWTTVAGNVGATIVLNNGDKSIYIGHKTTFTETAMTKASWSLKIYARP